MMMTIANKNEEKATKKNGITKKKYEIYTK